MMDEEVDETSFKACSCLQFESHGVGNCELFMGSLRYPWDEETPEVAISGCFKRGGVTINI